MSTEEIKATAVEAVCQHLELSEKTRVRLSVGTTIAICCSIIGATWCASWAIGNKLRDIGDGQARLESSLSYRVSVGQFASWSVQLERQNRGMDGGKGLVVPELPAVKTAPSLQPNLDN